MIAGVTNKGILESYLLQIKLGDGETSDLLKEAPYSFHIFTRFYIHLSKLILLAKLGCDPLEQTIGGETSLSKACFFSQGSIIQWYLNNNLSAFEIPDKTGKKPLEILKNSGE